MINGMMWYEGIMINCMMWYEGFMKRYDGIWGHYETVWYDMRALLNGMMWYEGIMINGMIWWHYDKRYDMIWGHYDKRYDMMWGHYDNLLRLYMAYEMCLYSRCNREWYMPQTRSLALDIYFNLYSMTAAFIAFQLTLPTTNDMC